MAGGVAAFLLKQAWNLLWKQGTPYYLPTVLVDGASGDGHTVPPLGNRPVPDLGPFGLFGDSTFGEVNLGLSGASIGGLGTAANGGFTYDETSQVFTATIRWQGLSYAGKYAVTGNGLLGCAAAGASGLMKIIPGLQVGASAVGGGDGDARLQQAREYRDQLVQTPAGLEMVGQYYDNNWAMNEVVRGQNVFTSYMSQNRPTSAGLADQTSAAAAAPDDPTKTVGDTAYYASSMIRQVIFERACQNAGGNGADDPFADAAKATLSFKGVVNASYTGPVTVGKVMTEVSSAPAGALRSHLLAASLQESTDIAPVGAFRDEEARQVYIQAHEEAQAFIRDYEQSDGPNRLFSELAALGGDMPIGSGTFTDTFPVPDVVITGTVAVTGDPNNPQLTVTLTKLTATLPNIAISLSSGGNWPYPNLYDKVTQALANAGFVHDLIRSKLGDKLGDPTVLTYLSNRINDAINKALGDF